MGFVLFEHYVACSRQFPSDDIELGGDNDQKYQREQFQNQLQRHLFIASITFYTTDSACSPENFPGIGIYGAWGKKKPFRVKPERSDCNYILVTIVCAGFFD